MGSIKKNVSADLDVITEDLGALSITAAKIAAGAVTGAKLLSGKAYFTIMTATNATTPVNIFGAGGAPCALTLTQGFVIAKDTTASNVIVKNAASTVSTTAKGTTTGLATQFGTISNASYASGAVATVESSGAGESLVVLTFEVA